MFFFGAQRPSFLDEDAEEAGLRGVLQQGPAIVAEDRGHLRHVHDRDLVAHVFPLSFGKDVFSFQSEFANQRVPGRLRLWLLDGRPMAFAGSVAFVDGWQTCVDGLTVDANRLAHGQGQGCFLRRSRGAPMCGPTTPAPPQPLGARLKPPPGAP